MPTENAAFNPEPLGGIPDPRMGDDGTGHCRGCGCSIGTFNEGCAVCIAALDAIHHGPLRRDYSIIRTEAVPWRAALQRAAYVVHHLVERVPEFTGVIGPGGEREDDWIRDSLHAEADEWKAIANAR